LKYHLPIALFHASSSAEKSLVEATDQRWRRCDRYSTFHGAFVGLLSNNEIKTDYLGAGLEDEEAPDDASPVPPPAPTPLPREQGHLFPAISAEGSVIFSTPRHVNHSSVLSAHKEPQPLHKSGSLKSPSKGRSESSSAINVQISPNVDIHLHSEYVLVSLSVGLTGFLIASTPMSRNSTSYQAELDVSRMLRNDYGYWFNHYLETHGFDTSAADSFHRLFVESASEEDFVNRVVGRKITHGEASFIFHLMQDRPRRRFG
jgi:hypothetical protein